MTPLQRLAGRRVRAMLVTLTLVVVAHDTLAAHDMWIEPAAFNPDAGQIVPLRLRVGQDLLGDPLPRDSRLIRDFIVEDAEGRKPVVGRDGSDPAGFIRAARPGLVVVGYHSAPSTVLLTPEKFEQYVREEGLDHIVASGTRSAAPPRGGRDAFTRCAKSLVLLGAPGPSQHDRALGMTLELVAERNPYLLTSGELLPVRLTYFQKPLAGALVVAVNRRQPLRKISARTDAGGRVRLPLEPGGTWLIKAVHMTPAPAGSDADWTSYWASLTFGERR
ncbi:MAG TPA: DUF4198 domain-containing protein [Vicinamibacterales bacterium]|nr:DUF4198 domain-containing protein [Vicinamibacterales bacterium]